MSSIRQNFPIVCESEINKQINLELQASYIYLSMAYYFERDDQALFGFSKYFKTSSDEEREHAQKFMKYQNDRGGRITMENITKPSKDDWGSALKAVEAALQLEKDVNEALLKMHKVASDNNDPHFCDFLESNFLNEQVDAIKELADLITNMKRAGDGVGLNIIDEELRRKD